MRNLFPLLMLLLLAVLPASANPRNEIPLYPGLQWSQATRQTSPLDGKTRMWVRTTARTSELAGQSDKVMGFYTNYLQAHGWSGAPAGGAGNWVMEFTKGDQTARVWMWTSETGASDGPADPRGPMLGIEWPLSKD